MRVLIAPDKFKGSLTAQEAAQRLADGWRRAWPENDLRLHPVADGGDGTLAVMQPLLGATWRRSPVHDARGRSVEAPWLWDAKTATAWIEVAQVVGLAALAPAERDPLTATSAGVGELIEVATHGGAQRIFVCLGGSATNDAGCGMAAALGFRFLDGSGNTLDPVPARLAALDRIVAPPAEKRPTITGLADVTNPLLGPNGASRVYGPQKGASPADTEILESVLARVAAIAQRDLKAADPAAPSAGAAGGLGYGLAVFLGGSVRPGFDVVAEATSLAEAIAEADLVLTGEGRLDTQTISGKAPAGVARLARAAGKRVIALAGSVAMNQNAVQQFDAVVPITARPMTLDEAMRDAGVLLEAAAERTARLVRLGQTL